MSNVRGYFIRFNQTRFLSLVTKPLTTMSALDHASDKPPLGTILLNPCRLRTHVISDNKQSAEIGSGDLGRIAKFLPGSVDNCSNSDITETSATALDGPHCDDTGDNMETFSSDIPLSCTPNLTEQEKENPEPLDATKASLKVVLETSRSLSATFHLKETDMANSNPPSTNKKASDLALAVVTVSKQAKNNQTVSVPSTKSKSKKKSVLPTSLLANVTELVKQQRINNLELNSGSHIGHDGLKSADKAVEVTHWDCEQDLTKVASMVSETEDEAMKTCSLTSTCIDSFDNEHDSDCVFSKSDQDSVGIISTKATAAGNKNNASKSDLIGNIQNVDSERAKPGIGVGSEDANVNEGLEEIKLSTDKTEEGDSLLEDGLIFPDLLEDFKSKEQKKEEVYDVSSIFTGELDRRYKSEKKKAITRKRKKPKSKKSQEQGSENGDEEDEENKNKGKKPVPNYFIAIQITNKEIHGALQLVQDQVLARNQLLSPAMIKLAKLHLTLMVLRLENEGDLARSRLALDNAVYRLHKTYSDRTLQLDICGLGNFRNEIVFAKIKEDQQVNELKTIADIVEDSFLEQDLVSVDKRGFKPHVTVMKLSKAKHLRQKGIMKIDESLYEKYKSFEFGEEEVQTLQLCAMMKTDPSGYYHIEHEVQLTGFSAEQEIYHRESVEEDIDEMERK